MKKRGMSIICIILAAALLVSGCGNSISSEKKKESAAAASHSVTADPEPAALDEPAVETTDEAKTVETPENSNQVKTAAAAPMEIMPEMSEDVYDSASAAAAWETGEEWFEPEPFPEFNTEEYDSIPENGFRSVLTSPLSTFGADVDTASYANLRRMLNWGYTPDEIPSGAVRAEEMINYFSYKYDGPKEGEPFGVNAEIADCPWNPENKLLMLGLQTEKIDLENAPDTNLVFLIDVSGSMDSDDKLPLLKEAFGMLAEELGENDRVSIVTYAGSDEIVLEGVNGSNTNKILRALRELDAYGSTNGAAGIVSAYDLAEQYFIDGGNNRVIIASDGDFNVGVTSESGLYDLITEEKEKGIFLSVLGFGSGNYSDSRMEMLADKGNGNYYYIDSLREAKKVLVEEMGATLYTVAKDVKLQIEFNPAYVESYRQIGYENRAMAAEDFDDDKKDGGEIGAGHSVTVLYELVPAGKDGSGKELKYQDTQLRSTAEDSGEWLTLSIRYKAPDRDQSELLEYPIAEESYTEKPSEDFTFAAAVAEFAMVLKDSEYLADGSLRQVKNLLDEVDLSDEYREEFADLVYMIR